jgi:aminopeptidase N
VSRIRKFAFLSAALLALVTGCKSTGNKADNQAAQTPSEASSDLTWQEAQARKARLDNVSYVLNIDLNETDENFTGRVETGFDLKDATKPLRMEFFEGKVANITVNGKPVPVEAAKKPYWIELPAASLREGRNSVIIEYTEAYSHQGQGLHKFSDPQTKEVFLYTQFETFDANRFMPCFDQPDLRATFALTAEAPAKWEVISTTRETSVKVAKNGRKIWTFPKSLPIATYLFSLHAGPYKVWKDQYADIPLRLFSRPSMAKYVHTAEWFKLTKQGLKFYETYFHFKYPFKKYDQLIVPEFNAGAMENVGAVTFSEHYLRRSEPTRQQRMNTANTLLHEMAHMWFGDTVTMKWWNDLWLNESFATIMAAMSLHEATEFKEAWQDFFSSNKQWAYWEDSLVTTHPIEGHVLTVKQAFATFDGITYGKGASVLNQLRAYMTPEAFQKGIQDYIAANAMKNTEQKDFIGALQNHTKRDLGVWSERWLRQSGTDKVTANWTCNGGKLTELQIVTTPSPGAQFRPQAMNVGLYGDKNGQLTNPVTVHADLTQPIETIKGNWTCPSFVYPNLGDEGYVSVKLDGKSLDFAKKNLSLMKDDLLRTMVWDNLWQMVRATEMPLKDYVEIVNKHFPNEKNDVLLQQILVTITTSRHTDNNILNYWPKNEASQKERGDFIVKMEQQFLKRFHAAKPGSDDQKLWFDSYAGLAQTPSALDNLAKWAREDKVAPGFTLDLDRRWTIVRQLTRYNHPEAGKLLAEMKTKDTSDRGVRSAMAVEAIQPDPGVKQKWFNIFKQPKPSMSFEEARTVMGSMFPTEQRPMAKAFEPEFYQYLKANGESEDAEIFVESVASTLSPLSCDAQTSAKLKTFLSEPHKFLPTITKVLKVGLQEDERCQKIRAAANL